MSTFYRITEIAVSLLIINTKTINIAMSPISNNWLYKKIKSHPFHELFCKVLCVTLHIMTDDPLLLHLSKVK